MIEAREFLDEEPEKEESIYQTDEWYYNDIDYVTNSHLSALKKGPRHLKKLYSDILNGTRETTKELDFGNAFHKRMLEPDKFDEHYFILDTSKRPNTRADFRNKENREWKKEQQEKAGDMKVITIDDYNRIVTMEKNFNISSARQLLENSRVEYVHMKEITLPSGRTVIVKCKVDAETKSVVSDIKTTSKPVAYPYFAQTVNDYDYDRQLAFYLDITGAEEAFIIGCETLEPHSIAIYKLSEETLERGRDKYIELLEMYCDLKDNDMDVNKFIQVGVI